MKLPHDHQLLEFQPGVFGLKLSATGAAREEVLRAAVELARTKNAKELGCRCEIQPDPAGPALERAGFRKRHERVEYKSPIDSLPLEDGTPLTWKPMPDKSPASLMAAARLLERCGQGDPDWGADDDARALLEGYLADPVLRGEADCVQIATLHGNEAAIVVAQVNPRSGWSRITYMGVAPELRGRSIGKWVHRHGFAMMRAQGGIIYHGGTLASNLGMRRLFETHGCELFRTLEEWVWKG